MPRPQRWRAPSRTPACPPRASCETRSCACAPCPELLRTRSRVGARARLRLRKRLVATRDVREGVRREELDRIAGPAADDAVTGAVVDRRVGDERARRLSA